jgi:hypothetical protein
VVSVAAKTVAQIALGRDSRQDANSADPMVVFHTAAHLLADRAARHCEHRRRHHVNTASKFLRQA